ncbi:DUF4231 domain-containing protein [Nonomuraea sp. B19D2]|uniref:DUF4231 domain-containing protein n=1 Tax=Nonomuraea sp. B19D2 TaxID=3159561 RepID=UPI0032DB5CB5
MIAPLLARFPKLRTRADSSPVIPQDQRDACPGLADDFEVIDRELTPSFAEYDSTALREQNRHRRQQVLILFGSALLTGLGGLQAVFPGQRWPTILLAVIGVALAASARYTNESESLQRYLTTRVKAERLRALHFRYLARTGPYAGSDRQMALRRAVLAVHHDKEPE